MASDDKIREEHGMLCMPFSIRIISEILSEVLKEKSDIPKTYNSILMLLVCSFARKMEAPVLFYFCHPSKWRSALNNVMYKTIFVINIIIHMCLQHSNTL